MGDVISFIGDAPAEFSNRLNFRTHSNTGKSLQVTCCFMKTGVLPSTLEEFDQCDKFSIGFVSL